MASSNSFQGSALDFDQLRAEGIRHIQRLAGQRWTDYNTHDPGITLLEVLCYALTDLSYRSGFSLPTLLGKEGVAKLQERYGPAQVLPGAPISAQDLRKLLLDVSGARGERIEAVADANPRLYYHPYDLALGIAPLEGAGVLTLKGLFRAWFAGSDANAARNALLANRPLCVDWYEIKDMGADPIVISTDLELAPDASQPAQIAQLAFRALSAAITPTARFQNREAALLDGVAAEYVFEGPLLTQGYLADAELDKLAQRDFLRASDLIQVLMDVPGVLAVKNIRMGKERWLLPLTPGKYPILATNSTVTLFRSSLRETFPYDEQYFALENPVSTPSLNLTAGLPAGTDRNIGAYYPIRYHLPTVYGLDAETLPEDNKRRAQVRQWSGYLLFFEQFLADSAAQLAQARALFDFEGNSLNTYTVQVLRNVPGALELYGWREDEDQEVFVQQLQQDLQQAVEPKPAQRLNQLLDHLLARLAENFSDYTLLVSSKPTLNEQLPYVKQAFLRDYPAIGLTRGTGCDYSKAFARSGLEHRIARLLGLPWPPQEMGMEGVSEVAANAAILYGETFFMVEHILLRPVPKDLSNGEEDYLLTDVDQPDPYSRQLTWVFPNYALRFAAKAKSGAAESEWDAYWNLVQTTLRRETPAHLIFNVLLLDQVGMTAFSAAYRSWREALANPEGIDNNAFRVARDRMMDLLVEMTPGQRPKIKRFFLGWSRPILDLQVKVPVVAPGTRAPVTLMNSQAGVTYILCDWIEDPVKDANGQLITAAGTGYDIDILLPSISKDTTFLLKAQKNLPGQSAPSEGFLRQKLRIRVGIDTKVPVFVLDPEIDYNKGARVRLDNTQAEVRYTLLNLQNVALSAEWEGRQGESIELTTQPLLEDTTFRVRATRTFGNAQDVKMLEGSFELRVRPNPALNAGANTIIVAYNVPATFSINLPQASAKYQVYTRPIRDIEFTNVNMPATWTAGNLTNSLTPLNLNANSAIPSDFSPVGVPIAGTGNNMSPNPAALLEDSRFLLFAKKDRHDRGVILTNSISGAILVLPNPNVTVQLSATQIDAGQQVKLQITNPQPGVWYKLYKKGETVELDGAYYHNTLFGSPGEDGIEAVRLEFDFFVGDSLAAPLVLTSPALSADTEFEIRAEKVQTGLKVTLSAVLKVTINQPPTPRGFDAPPPQKPPTKRKPRKKDKE